MQAICLNLSIVSSFTIILEKASIKIIISNIKGAANNESSHVLWIDIIFSPPQKMAESYSSRALFESPTVGTYLITTKWSGCSWLGYKTGLFPTISSITEAFVISFDLKHL